MSCDKKLMETNIFQVYSIYKALKNLLRYMNVIKIKILFYIRREIVKIPNDSRTH